MAARIPVIPNLSRRPAAGTRVRSAVFLAALAGAPASAVAQRALDRPLYSPLDTTNSQLLAPPRPTVADRVRFQNAIVTGNAPGGASFRGDVGYTAPFEFRGSLGSDDTFAFRRDSLFSGLGGQGIRGTDALQYQFALTTGSSVPQGLAGSLSFNRPGGVGAAGSLAAGGFAAPAYNPAGAALRQGRLGDRPGSLAAPSGFVEPGQSLLQPDRPGVPAPDQSGGAQPGSAFQSGAGSTGLATLRSTSAFQSVRTLRPELLAYADGGRQRLVASGLTGVQIQQREDFSARSDNRFGISAPVTGERPVTQPVTAARPESAHDQLVERLRVASSRPASSPFAENPLDGDPADQADATNPLAGDRPFDPTAPFDPANPNAGDPSAPQLQLWEQRLAELQQQLGELERAEALAVAEADAQAQSGTPSAGLGRLGVDGLLPPNPNAEAGDSAGGPVTYRFDPETMRLIRDAGGRVTDLAPAGSVRDVYVEHMAVAQRRLAEGRYFDAEERFTRALAARSGDVSARIGRIHAQLGAALFLSSGVNLRALLREHPEMAGVIYAAPLLPSSERLSALVPVLRDTMRDSPEAQRESALLLAYVGFQAGSESVLEEGLAVMRSDRFVDVAGVQQLKPPDPLAEFLGEIWRPLIGARAEAMAEVRPPDAGRAEQTDQMEPAGEGALEIEVPRP